MTRGRDPEMARGRFASNIRHAVEQVLARGLADPRVKGLITVTEFELSKDKRNATISVSILPEEAEDLTMHGLRAATTHIRGEAMKRVRSRNFPHITFILDKAVKEQAKILALINKAADEPPVETSEALQDTETKPASANDLPQNEQENTKPTDDPTDDPGATQ